MTRRYTGGFLSATEQATDANTANGIFTLSEAAEKTALGNFPVGRWTPQRSLRFRSSASAQLNRNYSGTGTSATTKTFSMWVKRGSLGSLQRLLNSNCATASTTFLRFNSSDNLDFQWESAGGISLTTTQVFRDPSAWYHIVLVLDSTKDRPDHRVRIYVNGVIVTSFGTANYPAQNATTTLFGYVGAQNRIGTVYDASGEFFDGYLSELIHVDGQALDASYFGQTDPETGTWVPKRYTGTYGTNGFYLPFSDNSSLDGSGGTPTSSVSYNVGFGAWIVMNKARPIPNNTVVDAIGFWSNSVENTKYNHIVRSDGGNNYTIVASTAAYNHTGGGLQYTALTSPYTIPSTGTYYMATWCPGSGLNWGHDSGSSTSSWTYYAASASPSGTVAWSVYASATTGEPALVYRTASLGLTADKSTNTNFWIANNISLTPYSNYDSMVDVPGIASASAQNDVGGVQRGNYNTWNPLTNSRSGGTISNGNLKTDGSLNNRPLMLGTQYFGSGKWYCEIWCGAFGNSGDNKAVGITTVRGQTDTIGSSILLTYGSGVIRAFANSNNNSLDYRDGFGNITDQGQGQLWWVDGFWIGLAVDVDNNTMSIYKNGTLSAKVTNCNLVGKEWTYFWEPESSSSRTPATGWYWNFGQQPFVYTPPAGHKGLCTTNLPNPIIKKPSDHFDVKTWVGNGSSLMIGTNPKQLSSASINKSLKFRSNNYTALTWTPSATATSNQKLTYSAWIKRSTLGGGSNYMHFGLSSAISTTARDVAGRFGPNDFLEIYLNEGTSAYLVTSQAFKNTTAWYHIVVAVDTTQTSPTNRIKLFVNGVQITSFSTNTQPAQNYTFTGWLVPGKSQELGRHPQPNYWFDGYMAEVNVIDGQQLDPTNFGQFDANNNWAPKTYTGTYGTNGFYLPLSTPTTLETLNYGATFNGVSQGLTTTASGFNGSTGTWTVEGWAFSGNPSANEAIITGQVSGTDYFYWNYTGTTLYFGDGVTNTISVSNAKPDNRWFHWAIVKNGSTYTLYIDGASIGSTTTALRSGTLTQWQIGIRTSQSYYWSGAISNVRVNNTTAVYTANFTPPTAALTAISGTQLLTCNSATLVDNSTNAYTITNTGSVPVISVSPWQRTVGYDASGNGNKFSPYRLSVTPNPAASPDVVYYGTPGTYTWTAPAGVTSVNYLVVAGGGAGGGDCAGGGAGGMLTGTLAVTPLSPYTVTVGAGGKVAYPSTNGSNSVFASLTAVGGGKGGDDVYTGGNGGSGGGGGYNAGLTAGTGTAGQGNNGGTGQNGAPYATGGGGGAGSAGAPYNTTGNGGNGLVSSITGTAIYYAGGGGGRRASPALGGLGGGGNALVSGVNGLGGGGGGSGDGGSGVVILSYTNAASYVGTGAGSSINNDSVFDSPVDTVDSFGNPIGNHCIWNSNFPGTITNGGLTVTCTATPTTIGTLGMTTGKWYWEIIPGSTTSGGWEIGVVTSQHAHTSSVVGGDAYGWSFVNDTRKRWNSNTDTYGTSYTTGDVIGVAVDMDAKTMTFYKNGTSQGIAFNNLSGTVFPAVSTQSASLSSNSTANFGQSKFVYTPPTGYKPLNTKNLKDVGSYNLPDSFGNFVNTPDLVWIKIRNATSQPIMSDTVRGPGRVISPNVTNANTSDGATGLQAFLPNGYYIGAENTGLGSSNSSGNTYVGWSWNRGTIPGFDIVNYAGTGAVQTINHGLGQPPKFMMVKKLSSATNSNWMIYHASLGPTYALNTNNASNAGTTYWNSTSPTSTTFTLDTNANYNSSGDTFIAYLWAEVPGFSKMGTYVGNSSSAGPFIYTGFKPRWVMAKATGTANGTNSSTVWTIWDTQRNTYNPTVSEIVMYGTTVSESTDTNGIDILSNGFRPTRNSEYANWSGTTYIYVAFAEAPFKYANAR